MDKRLLIKKRKTLPVAQQFGVLSDQSVDILLDYFHETPPTLNTALKLRCGLEINNEKTARYNQYDIQLKESSAAAQERNYTLTPKELVSVEKELADMLASSICRMRYATIFSNDQLDWHIDSPHIDRFVVVLQGLQNFYIDSNHGECKIPMHPGEVWYVNSNWKHKVENYGIEERIALLGCFDYDK